MWQSVLGRIENVDLPAVVAATGQLLAVVGFIALAFSR